ncbi:MAG TPA: InlB B-repeat-containing protein, partial [Methanocorpusculum sp.]|nr:InlB B-repeat-containing protein [Methanocorpusculum sp.]
TGYTFDKWYSDEELTTAWTFTTDTVTADTTLYAKWTGAEGIYISGTIENADGKTVHLKLMYGTKEIKSTDCTTGTFLFEDVEKNVYDIIAECDGKIVTIIANTLHGSDTGKVIKIPAADVKSELEINGQSTPAVSVGELDTEAETISTGNPGKSVELKLIVEQKSTSNPDEDLAKLIDYVKEVNPKAEITPLSIEVLLLIDEDEVSHSELSTPLEIYIPLKNAKDLSGLAVHRIHDGEIKAFDPVNSSADHTDGTFSAEDNGIFVYADKFSYYAVSYTKDTPVTSSSSGGKPAEIFVKATVDKGVIGDYGRDATKDVSNWPTDKSSSYKFTVSTVGGAGAAGTLQVQVAGYQAGIWGWGDHDFKMYQVDANGTMTPLQTVYSGEKNGNWQYTAYYTPTGGVDTFVFKPESGATEDKAIVSATAASAAPTAAPAVQQTAAPVVAEQTALPTAAATKVATAAATEAAKSPAPLAGVIAGAMVAAAICRRK